MSSKYLTIKQTAEMIGVDTDTLRRWDENGQFKATRGENNYRYYNIGDVEKYIKNNPKDLFRMAKNWAVGSLETVPDKSYYCQDSYIFQSRFIKLEQELSKIENIKDFFSLISLVTGEIGNNSFDHNLGNWPDVPGIFFAYDLKKREIILADRGQGILTTLKKVKPGLTDHQEALKVAFTEIISGRSPESRGNGLKVIKEVISKNEISLIFQTGDALLEMQKNNPELNITKTNNYLQGCLALIKF